MPKAKSEKIVFYGTGRRKKSIARVRLVEGTGVITINGDSITPVTSLSGYATESWVNNKGYSTLTLPDVKADSPTIMLAEVVPALTMTSL